MPSFTWSHLLVIAILILVVAVYFELTFSQSPFKSLMSNLPPPKPKSWQSGDGREQGCLDFVRSRAGARGDPQAVLDAIDQYGRGVKWLMNVGDDKGKILRAAVDAKRPMIALEIGAFVGYSAVLIGARLPEGGRLVSVEFSPANAAIARQMVDYAGLSDKVTIIEGTVTTVLKDYAVSAGISSFDLVFIDHDKSYYLSDFQYLLNEHLVSAGSIIVGDNIIYPGAPDFRAFVNSDPSRFRTVEHTSNLEYMPDVVDMVTVTELLK